jgi:hypothetical protein
MTTVIEYNCYWKMDSAVCRDCQSVKGLIIAVIPSTGDDHEHFSFT